MSIVVEQRNRRNVAIAHHFEYNVLVQVEKSGPEGIYRVCRRLPVQNGRLCLYVKMLLQCFKCCRWRHRKDLIGAAIVTIGQYDRYLEVAHEVAVEVVVTWKVGVQDELGDAIRLRIAQHVHAKCDIVEEIVVLLRRVGALVVVVMLQLIQLFGLVKNATRRAQCTH